jgi:AraC-like DNA-binding protein
MSELKDRCEEIDNVVGISRGVQELSEQISSSSNSSCLRLIEGWIEKQLYTGSRNQVGPLVSSIRETQGNTSVVEMADRMNISRRHLNRLLQREVGLSPKSFARIIRFDAAVQLCRIRPTISLAQIALRSGYADQAHMNREFVQIGGIRPADLHKPGGDMIW